MPTLKYISWKPLSGYGIAIACLFIFFTHSSGQTPHQRSIPTYKVDTILISNVNFYQEFADLLLLFKAVDIQVTNNSKIHKKENILKEIKLQLTHPQGMNFKLRITNFKQVTFRFVFDQNRQFQYFTFRINEEKVYQQIPLDTKGFKSYDCFEKPYQVVQRGTTNHPIERTN